MPVFFIFGRKSAYAIIYAAKHLVGIGIAKAKKGFCTFFRIKVMRLD